MSGRKRREPTLRERWDAAQERRRELYEHSSEDRPNGHPTDCAGCADYRANVQLRVELAIAMGITASTFDELMSELPWASEP